MDYCRTDRRQFYKSLFEEHHLTPEQVGNGFTILQLTEMFGGGCLGDSLLASITEQNDDVIKAILRKKGRLKKVDNERTIKTE